MNQAPQSSRVVITDFDMPFLSLVTFLIKVALASIPAAIIVAIFYAAIAFFGGMLLTFLGVALSGLTS